MPDNKSDYGLLLNNDAKIHRLYFKQMVKLLGINCWYRFPLKGSFPTSYGEWENKFSKAEKVGCIFQDHPDQKTLKKMGWVAELQENSSIIHVPYDLSNLQVGAIFEVPSGLDEAKPRRFRVISMQNSMIYPASIACEIAPEYTDTDELSLTKDFTKTNFNVLVDNEEDD